MISQIHFFFFISVISLVPVLAIWLLLNFSPLARCFETLKVITFTELRQRHTVKTATKQELTRHHNNNNSKTSVQIKFLRMYEAAAHCQAILATTTKHRHKLDISIKMLKDKLTGEWNYNDSQAMLHIIRKTTTEEAYKVVTPVVNTHWLNSVSQGMETKTHVHIDFLYLFFTIRARLHFL